MSRSKLLQLHEQQKALWCSLSLCDTVIVVSGPILAHKHAWAGLIYWTSCMQPNQIAKRAKTGQHQKLDKAHKNVQC